MFGGLDRWMHILEGGERENEEALAHGGVAESRACLAGFHPKLHANLAMAVITCRPSTQEVEGGGSRVQGHPQPESSSQAR